jgi:hypothetical protein
VHVFDTRQRHQVVGLGFGQRPQRMFADYAVARQVPGTGFVLAPGADFTQYRQLRP